MIAHRRKVTHKTARGVTQSRIRRSGPRRPLLDGQTRLDFSQVSSLKEKTMFKIVFALSLAACGVLAVGVADAGTGTARTLMSKDLPDFPGKEGLVEMVDFAPGEISQPHRHNADLFVYVLEGSVVTQVKGDAPKTIHAGGVFYESPSDIHTVSRNASGTEPAKLLVFYVKEKGTPPTVLVGGKSD
jgi:quercetin dioxygenase-like cupin family protein